MPVLDNKKDLPLRWVVDSGVLWVSREEDDAECCLQVDVKQMI